MEALTDKLTLGRFFSAKNQSKIEPEANIRSWTSSSKTLVCRNKTNNKQQKSSKKNNWGSLKSEKKNELSKTTACSEAVEEIHYFLATTGHFHLAQTPERAFSLSQFSSLMRPESICVWPSWKLLQEAKRMSKRSKPDFLWKPSARTLQELDGVLRRREEARKKEKHGFADWLSSLPYLLASITPNSGWTAVSGRAADQPIRRLLSPTASHGFTTGWICEINPKGYGNIPTASDRLTHPADLQNRESALCFSSKIEN